MSILSSKDFWAGTLERAIKTFAQSAVALLTANYTSLIEVDFVSLAAVAGLAAVVSVLTRIAGAGDNDLKSQVLEEEKKKEVETEEDKLQEVKELGE